jgi:sortase A
VLITGMLAAAVLAAVTAGVMLTVPGLGFRDGPASGHDAPQASVATEATEAPAPLAPDAGAAEFQLLANAPSVPRPDLPGRIVIPSIALDAKVVEVGIVVEKGKPVWETAAFAVGFHRGTALPGTKGNAVMAGHISSPVSRRGDIFRRLPEVRIGDRVQVYVGERRVTYEVTEIRVVSPTAVQVMDQTPDATLTLITCYPDNDYSRRLVVVGKLLEQM